MDRLNVRLNRKFGPDLRYNSWILPAFVFPEGRMQHIQPLWWAQIKPLKEMPRPHSLCSLAGEWGCSALTQLKKSWIFSSLSLSTSTYFIFIKLLCPAQCLLPSSVHILTRKQTEISVPLNICLLKAGPPGPYPGDTPTTFLGGKSECLTRHD